MGSVLGFTDLILPFKYLLAVNFRVVFPRCLFACQQLTRRPFSPVQAGKEHSWEHGGVWMVQKDWAASGSQRAGQGEGAFEGCLQSIRHGVRHPTESRRGVAGGNFSPLFPLGRNNVPAVKEALKKGGREARQDCGKLGEEQAKHYTCWLRPCGGNLIVILDSSWEAALIPAFAISCQAHAPNLLSLPLSKADHAVRSCQHQSR